MAHIRRTHSHDPNFLITCGRPGCCKAYKQFSSFKSHIYRNHPELLEETDQANDDDIISDNSDCPCPSADSLSSMDESESDDEANEEKMRENMALRNVALFLLKTRECNKLSQTAMNNLMD